MDNIEMRGRFKDAPWFNKDTTLNCIIGGAGGIGSWLSVLLARVGVQPFIYDFDRIETHNIGGQLFSMKHVGKLKVEALAEIVKDFTNIDMMTSSEKYDKDSMTTPIMFSAFDNMSARKVMFEKWRTNHIDNPEAIFIDARLLMEQLQIFCVTKATAEEYATTCLFTDEEVPSESCTMKQTSHAAAMIASLMVSFFTNHLTNVYQGQKVREVPFSYEYFIPLNLVT